MNIVATLPLRKPPTDYEEEDTVVLEVERKFSTKKSPLTESESKTPNDQSSPTESDDPSLEDQIFEVIKVFGGFLLFLFITKKKEIKTKNKKKKEKRKKEKKRRERERKTKEIKKKFFFFPHRPISVCGFEWKTFKRLCD